MGPCHETTTAFLTKLAYGLGRKRRPATIPLSKSLGPPAPQTSLSTSSRMSSLDRILTYSIRFFTVIELPDELILSILSHVSPDPPQHISHYAWFHMMYDLWVGDYRQQRVRFLRPLSMTCKAIRLRLLPWVWERLEFPPPWSLGGKILARKLTNLTNILPTDVLLATTVKYFHLYPSPGSGLIRAL